MSIMKLSVKYLKTFIALLILHTTKAEIPGCHYLETVDLSFSSKLPNGSYLNQDHLPVPPHLIGQYNYMKTERGISTIAKMHTRGCVCQLKPCIWFCCRFKDMQSNGECNDGLMQELGDINPYLNVTLVNGTIVRRNLLRDFIVLRDVMRLRDIWNEHEYTLFENGSVLLWGYNSGKKAFRGYDCLHPNQFSSGSKGALVVAFHESIYNRNPDTLLPGANELYLYVKKLRNLHGKCFICYMLTIYMFLLHKWLMHFDPSDCIRIAGYLLYFFLMARFIWVFSLSYQTWKGLTSINQVQSEHSFLAYSIFAWGTATLMTGLIFLMDQIWDAEPNKVGWIPGVGWEYCDLKRRTWDTYFIWPLVSIIALNGTLLTLTTISIITVRLSLKYFSGQYGGTTNSRTHTYKILMRLCIIMDLQWSVRIIFLYLEFTLFVRLGRYVDYSLGIIIFVFFILKRRTVCLLMESIRNERRGARLNDQAL